MRHLPLACSPDAIDLARRQAKSREAASQGQCNLPFAEAAEAGEP